MPGCVHTDLLAQGLIADPYLDDNETRLGWIGRTAWRYETSFDADDLGTDRFDLVCDGLDTVATLTLNGIELGTTANMHRRYRFDLRPAVQPGRNTLAVEFASAYAHAERMRALVGDRPGAYDEPYQYIRKMACNFGWDWGPTLVTAGIWRAIGLHAWSVARISRVRPHATFDGPDALVEVHVELDRATEEPVTVTVTTGETGGTVAVAPGATTAVVTLRIADAQRWWPVGYGAQPLHRLQVSLSGADGVLLDDWSRSIGLREVRVETAPDEHGSPFTLHVNDVPIFVKGVNWIPDDAFADRVTRDRLARRFDQAIAANVNFLRVWGGGVYESEDFYELADERGLLVGQDFLFACAAYPEEEPFASEVAAEARDNVDRLAHHPSLVLWTGNNENIWGFHDWGWQEPLAGRSWGAGFYHELLPAIVAERDPGRFYWPGSPWSGDPAIHPNDSSHGTMHIWDVWNQIDYTHYRDKKPRFVAEYGFQAPPVFATLRRSISDAEPAPDSPGMRHHQKAADGDRKLQRALDAHLPPPRDFDDWHYLTQLNQARAIRLGIEHFRSLRPHCMGSIVWQLNDCWPVTSWSAIDGDGRRKPLWYSLRDAYADRILTIQPGGRLIAINDTGEAWLGQAEVTAHALDGSALATAKLEIDVAPAAVTGLDIPAEVIAAGGVALRARLGDAAAWWFLAEDREIDYPPARFTTTVQQVPTGYRVTVTAETILRDLTLFPDRLDPSAEVDDAMITLLPGESASFLVTTSATLDAAALTTAPVLRCVNDIARA
ncbi:beta-mannosidase [Allocatelliglobosispora scoriae]|uniref:beta-mannosidase n=1 Tax=Allocatelliglobosispora scoriae TaxID=643052 RepID=A0A841BRU4_9ACTN|nr:glycoside hydrolase family 2 protein [Allocatelliglobosispora scoriae]MBB5869452.1 beta-mannosidase [Allocatelliglobosispora scoriae]